RRTRASAIPWSARPGSSPWPDAGNRQAPPGPGTAIIARLSRTGFPHAGDEMNGSMMQLPLLISSLLVHAERHHGEQDIVSRRGEGEPHRYTHRHPGSRARAM